MNDDTTILAHWPFVRAHLALGRRPAVGRVLDFIAEQQAKTLEPTAISAGWLRQWGASAGEAGRARTVARELAAAGVLHRWKGAGPRPDVWALAPRLERWRLPWTTPARSVDLVIRSCECRARFAEAARFAGQQPWKAARDSWFGPGFALPPSAHQHVREPWRAAVDNDRAASADRTPSDQDRLLVLARLSEGEEAPPTVLSGYTSTSYDDDAGMSGYGTLAGAIKAATGEAIFGRPRDALRRIAAEAGADLGPLARYLEAQTWARSPVVLVDMAEEWLADQRGRRVRTEDHTRRSTERRRALLESLVAAGEDLPPQWQAELAELRGTDTAVG